MPCNPIGATERRQNQFEKIRRLEEVTAQLLSLADEDTAESVNAACAPVPEGSFEQLVDPDAAHASLEKFMRTAESRFALAVTHLLDAGEVQWEEISLAVYEAGQEIALLPVDSAEEVYHALDMNILDGMPCDETREILESSADTVVWRQTRDMHSAFWLQAGGEPKHYTALLRAYADGLLSVVPYKLTLSDDGVFTLAEAE